MFCWGLDPPVVYRTKFPPLGGGTPAPPPPHPQNRHFKKFQNRLVLDCDWEVWDICGVGGVDAVWCD